LPELFPAVRVFAVRALVDLVALVRFLVDLVAPVFALVVFVEVFDVPRAAVALPLPVDFVAISVGSCEQ
jgi:hypothetical protein